MELIPLVEWFDISHHDLVTTTDENACEFSPDESAASGDKYFFAHVFRMVEW